MSAYECFCSYLALRAHFTTSYNYQKYEGRTKAPSPDKFHERRDVYFFKKLSHHQDPFDLMLSNFVENSNAWIRDIVSPEGETVHKRWLKRQESLTYVFKEDLEKLLPDFNANFVVPCGEHPNLVKLYIGGIVSPETFIILVDLARCFSSWDKAMDKDDVIWAEVSRKYQNYRPFLQYDKAKFKKIVFDFFA